ncbi:MAG: transposase [Rhodoferax sp.]|nr:transposase [Rhodoferax sp.]MBP7492513.1 transposase [Rhodoferax sp.]
MQLHLIFVTKYRRNVFDGDAIERLGEHFRRVANDFEAKGVACNGEDHHIHL